MKKVEDREKAEVQANLDTSNKFMEDIQIQLAEADQKTKSIFEAKEVDRKDVLKNMRDYQDMCKQDKKKAFQKR
tara:strand:+ start:661 stop:882 length:222 start_codon:yes stop_codon:yes gene_type:complete